MSNPQLKHDSIDYPDEPIPPHNIVEWHPRTETIGDVDAHSVSYIPNDSIATARPASGAIGWVISQPKTLAEYVAEHGHGTIDVPQYYSRFPNVGPYSTPSPEDYLATGPGPDDDDATLVDPRLVRASIRALNGKGRYPASEHTLYDCLPMPCPIVREDVGSVLIAPRVAPDGLNEE